MSITTKRGDAGMTDLMYGRRVAKDDPRVSTCGCLDELTSCLGLARVESPSTLTEPLEAVQRTLIVLMGQVAAHPQDRERFHRDGFSIIGPLHLRELTQACECLEKEQHLRFDDWVLPGAANVRSAAFLDMARAIARRAECHLVALPREQANDDDAIAYLNRLSDYLWLLARTEEKKRMP